MEPKVEKRVTKTGFTKKDVVPSDLVANELPSNYGAKFFYINLDRASERRSQMESQLTSRKIKFERVRAIDAQTLDPAYLESTERLHGSDPCAVAEIATTFSHLKAVFQFFLSGEPIGVILEDDAVFEYEPSWPYTLAEALSGAPSGWGLMTLSITTIDVALFENLMRLKQRYHLRKPNYYSAVAYALTRAHAITLLKRFDVSFETPLDEFACKPETSFCKIQSEPNILSVAPNIYFLYPPAFTYPTDNTSYIHPHHVAGHKRCKALVSRAYNPNDPLFFMPSC